MNLRWVLLGLILLVCSPALADYSGPTPPFAVPPTFTCSINGSPTATAANCANIADPQKARVIWTGAEVPLYRALIFTSAASVCGYWGNFATSLECGYAQQYFLGNPVGASLVFIRAWNYSSRAAIYGANTAATTLSQYTAISSGSANFSVTDSTPFGPWNVTGCSLASATALGPNSVATSVAALLSACINAYATSSGVIATTTTGAITSDASTTCTATGYSQASVLVITSLGTCKAIYVGALYSGTGISCAPSICEVTAQMSGSDGLPCPPSGSLTSTGASALCNGGAGTYNTFVGGGTTASESITLSYSILTFTSATSAISPQFWLQDGGVHVANPTAVWQLANSSEATCSGFTSNNCWIVTATGTAVSSESMSFTWPKMQVFYSTPTTKDQQIPLNQFYLVRDQNFPPDTSAISLPAPTTLTTLLGWTAASGAVQSSPGIAGCVNCEAWWLGTITGNYFNNFSSHQLFTTGAFAAQNVASQPNQEQGMLNWSGNTNGRFPYASWMGPNTTPIAPPLGTNNFLIISGGGSASLPVSNTNRWANMVGGYSAGMSATYAPVAVEAGIDYTLSNISAHWATGGGAPSPGTFNVGIMDNIIAADMNSPLPQDDQVVVSGSSAPINAGVPIQTSAPNPASPTIQISNTDKIAWEVIGSSTAVAPTVAPGWSAIGHATYCACSVVYGGSTSQVLDNTGATQFLAFGAGSSPNATANLVSIVMPAAGNIVGLTVDVPAATTGTAGWTFTLEQNGADVATWTGSIAGTNSTTNTKQLVLCAVPMSGCNATLPPLAFKKLDSFSLKSVSTGSPTAQTATLSLSYQPLQPGTSFLFFAATPSSATAANAFYSFNGLSAPQATELPLQSIPILTGHTVSISNFLAVQYETTAVVFNYSLRANTANSTTPANCPAAAITVGDTSAGNTNGCQNNTDTYTAQSFDQVDILATYISGTATNVSKIKGSMVVTVQ